jgi:hypothetical protein
LVIIKTYLRDVNQIKAKVYRAECMHRAFTIKDEYYPNSINVCTDINSYKLKTENRYWGFISHLFM